MCLFTMNFIFEYHSRPRLRIEWYSVPVIVCFSVAFLSYFVVCPPTTFRVGQGGWWWRDFVV